MSDLSSVPTEELLKMYQQPQSNSLSGMGTDELLRLYQQPHKSDPVGGVGSEIKRAFNENLDSVKRVYTDYQPDQPLQHLGRVGSALAAIPGMAAAPVTGAARSLIGGGVEAFDNALGLAPEQMAKAGLPAPREAADLAMMGVAPRGASPIGLRPDGVRMVRPPTPGPEDVKAAINSGYSNPTVTGLQIDPQAAKQFVAQTRADMLKNRVDPIAAPTVDKLLGNLENPRFGPTHGVSDFDLARQSISKDVPYNEGRAAHVAREAIDNYLGNIPTKDVVSGNARLANEILLDARGNHAGLKRYEEAIDALTRADNQAPSTYSGQNINNATRQQFRPMLNEKMGASKTPGFEDYNPQELERLKGVVHGTKVGNTARMFSKEMEKLPVPFVSRLLGLPGRMIGNASTRRQAETLAEALLSRTPLAQSLPPVPTARPNPVAVGAAAPTQMSQLIAALLGYRPALVPGRAEQEQ